MPLYTTIRRITKNLKTKYKSRQKIKLYVRRPTTKDLKRKYSSRLVGWAETGREDAVQQQGSEAVAVVASGVGHSTFTFGG